MTSTKIRTTLARLDVVDSIKEVLNQTSEANRNECSEFAQEKFSLKNRQEHFQTIIKK